jgi:hypothetical protein
VRLIELCEEHDLNLDLSMIAAQRIHGGEPEFERLNLDDESRAGG